MFCSWKSEFAAGSQILIEVELSCRAAFYQRRQIFFAAA